MSSETSLTYEELVKLFHIYKDLEYNWDHESKFKLMLPQFYSLSSEIEKKLKNMPSTRQRLENLNSLVEIFKDLNQKNWKYASRQVDDLKDRIMLQKEYIIKSESIVDEKLVEEAIVYESKAEVSDIDLDDDGFYENSFQSFSNEISDLKQSDNFIPITNSFDRVKREENELNNEQSEPICVTKKQFQRKNILYSPSTSENSQSQELNSLNDSDEPYNIEGQSDSNSASSVEKSDIMKFNKDFHEDEEPYQEALQESKTEPPEPEIKEELVSRHSGQEPKEEIPQFDDGEIAFQLQLQYINEMEEREKTEVDNIQNITHKPRVENQRFERYEQTVDTLENPSNIRKNQLFTQKD